MVVNRWKRPVRVKFVFSHPEGLKSVELFFEGRALQPVANGFEDEIEGYGTKVYRVKKESVRTPEQDGGASRCESR
jgi:hypothetical protein